MPRLHELLAVGNNLSAQAAKTRTELAATFKNKPHHFTEKLVTYKADEENVPSVTESQLDLQTTVLKELDWISSFIDKALDAAYQIAEANTVARADIILDDGRMFLSQVPVTSLLELEKRMKELFDFVTSIPTLDPAKGFQPDSDRGEGIYRAREIRERRTKKVTKVLTLAPPTDKHPAQVQAYTEDVPVGDILKQEWSGLITVADKGDMLARVEELTRAIKQARSRANEVTIDISNKKIGRTITQFVFGR